MSCSARGHSSPYSSDCTWEGTDANLLTGNWANRLSMIREHWWDWGLHSFKHTEVGLRSSIMDDRRLLHPEKELSVFSLACAQWAWAYLIYETYNLNLSNGCWTAELHMTHRNAICSGMVLSICFRSRRLIGNFRLTWGYIRCVCSWFNRIPLMVSDASITSVLHENREYLFSYLHCLQVNSHRIWGKPLTCSFMWCLHVRGR